MRVLWRSRFVTHSLGSKAILPLATLREKLLVWAINFRTCWETKNCNELQSIARLVDFNCVLMQLIAPCNRASVSRLLPFWWVVHALRSSIYHYTHLSPYFLERACSGNGRTSFEAQPCGFLASVQSRSFEISLIVEKGHNYLTLKCFLYYMCDAVLKFWF